MKTIRYCLLLTTLGLAACATTPAQIAPENKVLPYSDRQQDLMHFKNWDINGKIAMRTEKDNLSASLQWHQSINNYKISLFGPLGTYSLTLTGQPGHVNLESSDGKKVTARSPEALVNQQTGWKLPVSDLYYWVRGLAVPNVPAQKTLDAYHHLSELDQKGWHIQYLNYTTSHNLDLPTKIFMNHSGLNLKIIINEW
ncbi:MAG: lipoprotein insertase outer membrane protein LolB [Gammaproteobacteria bacterium]|nr:lipoprotein insertase outer membrane protein LolB [Gammaproteobacteria bacterium]